MPQSPLKILEKAINHNDIRTFRSTLQTHGLPNDDNYFDYELLIKSLRLGRKRIVNLLLDKGCHVSKPPTSDGVINSTTPLHIAVSKVGWSNVVIKLLARGARVDICNENIDTPIHVAFMNGATGFVIDILLKYYMRQTLMNLVDKDGLGLLHIACTRPHLDVVKQFVDIGGSNILSQVSGQTNSLYAGYTSLHFAVENGRHKVANFLCHYEADVGVVNKKGSTPLHLAVGRRDIKMIDILLPCADWNVNHVDSAGISHFMAACAGNNSDIVRQYLRIATDTSSHSLVDMISAQVQESSSFAGYTPMHFAAEFGRLETVQLLIDRGAHCTMNNQDNSPLDLARNRNHQSISELLERHCKMCKVCENLVVQEKSSFVDVNCNHKDEKSPNHCFNSTFEENQVPVLDDCCLLNIFPVPEYKEGDQIGDCELCKLQEILSIHDCTDQYHDNDSVLEKVEKSTNVNYNRRVNFQFCKYFPKRISLSFFVTFIACVYILVCVVFIAKHRFSCEEPTCNNN